MNVGKKRNIKISKFFSELYSFPNQSIILLQRCYLNIYMQWKCLNYFSFHAFLGTALLSFGPPQSPHCTRPIK